MSFRDNAAFVTDDATSAVGDHIYGAKKANTEDLGGLSVCTLAEIHRQKGTDTAHSKSASAAESKLWQWTRQLKETLLPHVPQRVQILGFKSVSPDMRLLREMGVEVNRTVDILSVHKSKVIIKVVGRTIGIDTSLADSVLVTAATE